MTKLQTLLLAGSATLALTTASHADFKGAVPLNLPKTFMTDELPPEPSAAEHPHLHATWSKLPNMPAIVPKLERHEGVYHAPHAPAAGGSAQNASSANWSGTALYGSPNQYGTTTVAMSVVVPSHHQAFGNCNNDGLTADATWVGTDGWGTGTVEQFGIWITVYKCGQASMGAFGETYPDPEIGIANFPVAAGDTISMFSTTNQANKTVCGVFVNESQNVRTYGTCLVAPGPFQARSAEWVVERPTYGNQYVNLSNYGTWAITNGWAWDSNGHTMGAAAAQPPSVGAPYAQFNPVQMMDNNWKMISYPQDFSPSVLLMHDSGSAYCAQGNSCVPQY